MASPVILPSALWEEDRTPDPAVASFKQLYSHDVPLYPRPRCVCGSIDRLVGGLSVDRAEAN